MNGLLQASGLARSTFYYRQKALQVVDKHALLKTQIKSVFEQHKGRYGYRRTAAAIGNAGTVVNHKTIQRLMGATAEITGQAQAVSFLQRPCGSNST
ncbi:MULTISPECIES: IS3 family transposase [unclassified Pseudomonas]|uniref:IS3 family transposase n=1 Tax=unclassified Pseudomonas TaxID=196821 RepID=UPI002AC89E28|nr:MULTISPECIES: IS3 family transposase [unclassified Pseudomonas]MEB0045735.1 IS3 family transposase [Pseudomonas sp. Dout3]MEB0098162.1 IS3 family transposase [Pseudomonas sp. DC1.2]WPX60107.1 IS3 family transposase [Pseudomonas sp. DC1.2]